MLVITRRELGEPNTNTLFASLVPHRTLYAVLLRSPKKPPHSYTRLPDTSNAFGPPAFVMNTLVCENNEVESQQLFTNVIHGATITPDVQHTEIGVNVTLLQQEAAPVIVIGVPAMKLSVDHDPDALVTVLTQHALAT